MRARRRRHAPLLTYVVDPFSPTARSWVPAVRELALRIGDEVPVEVVCTGDRGGPREDSRRAAAGVIALLAADRLHPVTVVEDVVRAFADRGVDIADPGAIAELAIARGLDADAVKVLAASPEVRQMADEDRELARGLGDPVGAALVYGSGSGTLGRGARLRTLPGPGASGRELVAAWTAITT